MKRFAFYALPLIAGAVFARADDHLGPVTDIRVFGTEIYSCSQGGIFTGSGSELKFLMRPLRRTTSLGGVRDGDSFHLLFAGGEPGSAGALGVFDLKSKTTRNIDFRGQDLVYDFAVLNDASVVVAQANGEVHVGGGALPTSRQFELVYKHTAAARAVATSPDGRWFASAGRDGVIILSEIVEGKVGKSRKLLDHTSGVECLVFSPDSQRLASGSLDSKVRLHELPGKLVRTYDGLGMENEPVAGRVQSRVLALAWQDQLVAGTSKGILYRLSLEDDTSRRIARNGRDPIYALAFDPRERLLLGGQGRIEILTLGRKLSSP